MSETVRRMLDSTPKNVKVFVDWYADLTVVINRLIEQKNIDREIPEVKEYLSGNYPFDLKSLSKLSEVLDYNLLNINKEILNNGV